MNSDPHIVNICMTLSSLKLGKFTFVRDLQIIGNHYIPGRWVVSL